MKTRKPVSATNAAAPSDRMIAGVCVLLVALVWAVFGRTAGFGFTNYDDGEYVYQNPHVTGGLTPAGVAWAFSHVYAANWHPLTWISHMADWQMYGRNAGGHHVTNVLLHAASVVLLFVALRNMTGAMWRSAFAAALFAIHPLRVESVAWVAERKDVLSGVFFMLTLCAYARYSRGMGGMTGRTREASHGVIPPGRGHIHGEARGAFHGVIPPGRGHIHGEARGAFHGVGAPHLQYMGAVGVFALGLMAKPSLVTLPFVLLLLDYWPLGRGEPWKRLVLEKAPFFGLSAVSCVVTLVAQTHALISVTRLPMGARLGNAAWSYLAYLAAMFWPVDLAVLYPINVPPWWVAVLSLAVLAGISAGAFAMRKGMPWLMAGWLWYLGMLAPMIGIVQVGGQARADRYTYLSGIGIAIAVAWSVESVARRKAGAFVGVAAVLGLAACAHHQVEYWAGSEELWEHALAVTKRNAIGHNLLAMALFEKGRPEEAMAHFRTSLRINPNDPGTHFHMGIHLAKTGKLDEGIAHLRRGLEIAPGDPGGETDLGLALAQKGSFGEAMMHYRNALKADPDFVDALNNMAWGLATGPRMDGGGAEAVKLAEHCCELTGWRTPEYLDTLAAAYAETGRFAEAVATAEKALAFAGGDVALAASLRREISGYRAKVPNRR